VFLNRPVLLKYWLLCPFSTRKSKAKAVPRKVYFTRCRSPAKSTSSVSARILCSDMLSWAQTSRTPKIHGTSRLLGTTVARRYDAPKDWLRDACHLARVRWGTRCKGFCSKEGPHYRIEQSVRNPLKCDQVWRVLGNCPKAVIGQVTINFIHEFEKPLRIPYPGCTSGCTALLSGGLCHARK
jgi:hypothetical protein